MTAAISPARLVTVRVIAAILFAGSVNALAQVLNFLPGWGNDPILLSAEQFVAGIAGLVAAVGAWKGRAWAWSATLAYGLLTGGLILSLSSLLGLGEDERRGLWVGALVVAGFCALLSVVLWRATRAPTEQAAP